MILKIFHITPRNDTPVESDYLSFQIVNSGIKNNVIRGLEFWRDLKTEKEKKKTFLILFKLYIDAKLIYRLKSRKK